MTSPLDSTSRGPHGAVVAETYALTTVAETPACSNCGRHLAIGDPEQIVCVAHLEFRSPRDGGDCAFYVPAKAFPDPPQLDGGPASAETAPRRGRALAQR